MTYLSLYITSPSFGVSCLLLPVSHYPLPFYSMSYPLLCLTVFLFCHHSADTLSLFSMSLLAQLTSFIFHVTFSIWIKKNYVHSCIYATYIYRCPWRPEVGFPGTGVTSGCKPPDVNSGKQTWALCKSSKDFEPRGQLSSA